MLEKNMTILLDESSYEDPGGQAEGVTFIEVLAVCETEVELVILAEMLYSFHIDTNSLP